MKTWTTVIEKCSETGLYVGYIPGFAGAHTQASSLDELKENMEEVLSMLLEDGIPKKINEFVGTTLVQA
ncbi:MAG: type II toxin-antitoxin system HicB family antitoxin [Gammaproteobacteria bacterium]|nr:MAG: type II toxin-antitoxin system HicB family antitoxin [Gammaproteobacteria bacterium]